MQTNNLLGRNSALEKTLGLDKKQGKEYGQTRQRSLTNYAQTTQSVSAKKINRGISSKLLKTATPKPEKVDIDEKLDHIDVKQPLP